MFDHSSCHAAMADDALDVNAMNVKPGGKQRIIIWNGKEWRMYTTARDGTKVARNEESGVSTAEKGADWMRETLAKHSDFRDEKSMIEHSLIEKGHVPCFLPKFHPEINPIQRVWAQLHQGTLLPSLRKNIPLPMTVTLENHFRKVCHYMFCYLEGLTPGVELDKALKKYNKAVKSHRKIGINECTLMPVTTSPK